MAARLKRIWLAAMIGSALPMAPTLLAASYAFTKTFGLLVVFLGIGLLVNIILVIIALQIRGERQQNKAELTEPQDRTRPV